VDKREAPNEDRIWIAREILEGLGKRVKPVGESSSHPLEVTDLGHRLVSSAGSSVPEEAAHKP
jgi:hypothetical protein